MSVPNPNEEMDTGEGLGELTTSSLFDSKWNNTPSLEKLKTKIRLNRNIKFVGLEDFDPIRIVGKGAMSNVYIAKLREDPQQEFAIKIVKRSSPEADAERNEERKKDLLALVEKDIVTERNVSLLCNKADFLMTIVASFRTLDRAYFIMPAMKCSLDVVLKQLPQRGHTCRIYAAEIAAGLKFLHGHKIIHSDLKPDNILLDNDNHLKITDFGFSLTLRENEETVDTRGQSELYSPPEFFSDRKIGMKADIWAFGMVVIDMVVLQEPDLQSLEQLLRDEPNRAGWERYIRKKLLDIEPKDFRSFVDGLLEYKAENRHVDVSKLGIANNVNLRLERIDPFDIQVPDQTTAAQLQDFRAGWIQGGLNLVTGKTDPNLAEFNFNTGFTPKSNDELRITYVESMVSDLVKNKKGNLDKAHELKLKGIAKQLDVLLEKKNKSPQQKNAPGNSKRKSLRSSNIVPNTTSGKIRGISEANKKKIKELMAVGIKTPTPILTELRKIGVSEINRQQIENWIFKSRYRSRARAAGKKRVVHIRSALYVQNKAWKKRSATSARPQPTPGRPDAAGVQELIEIE